MREMRDGANGRYAKRTGGERRQAETEPKASDRWSGKQNGARGGTRGETTIARRDGGTNRKSGTQDGEQGETKSRTGNGKPSRKLEYDEKSNIQFAIQSIQSASRETLHMRNGKAIGIGVMAALVAGLGLTIPATVYADDSTGHSPNQSSAVFSTVRLSSPAYRCLILSPSYSSPTLGTRTR